MAPPCPAKYVDRPKGTSKAASPESLLDKEREFLHTINPNHPGAWLDLARTFSELVEQLDRLVYE